MVTPRGPTQLQGPRRRLAGAGDRAVPVWPAEREPPAPRGERRLKLLLRRRHPPPAAGAPRAAVWAAEAAEGLRGAAKQQMLLKEQLGQQLRRGRSSRSVHRRWHVRRARTRRPRLFGALGCDGVGQVPRSVNHVTLQADLFIVHPTHSVHPVAPLSDSRHGNRGSTFREFLKVLPDHFVAEERCRNASRRRGWPRGGFPDARSLPVVSTCQARASERAVSSPVSSLAATASQAPEKATSSVAPRGAFRNSVRIHVAWVHKLVAHRRRALIGSASCCASRWIYKQIFFGCARRSHGGSSC